jgi:hypothetical protein
MMPRAVCHDPTTIFGGFSLPAEEKKKERKKEAAINQASIGRVSKPEMDRPRACHAREKKIVMP